MADYGRYPIGEQDFASLRNKNSIYIDKTRYIEKIIMSGSKSYFLARPRRFGKSLFLSTLRYFFEGKRELYKGLYIDGVDWKWEAYPVLRLDLNTEKYYEEGLLDAAIDNLFSKWENLYDVELKAGSASSRFQNIIEAAHRKTGKQVVILVDEYDKPLVGNINDDRLFEHFRTKLASLYSNFKSSADHIRLVFMTGVSRFSKLSIFSDLNNLDDITFENEYADICGITEEELKDNLSDGVDALSKEYELSTEEVYNLLKKNYDGYRFAEKGSEIYNPWSLLNCLSKRNIGNYWNMTGIPTVIAEALKSMDADIEAVLNMECDKRRLLGLDLKNLEPLALLYQTGYLTIKDYDREMGLYTLGTPNLEVKQGLFDVLLPYYVKVRSSNVSDIVIQMTSALRRGQPDNFMKYLQTYFAGIPYQLKMNNENNFHNAFYILMTILGFNTEAEASTSNGRIDLLIKTENYIYIIELKYNSSAELAIRQIEEKEYAKPFLCDSRKIILIGANFSSKTRNIKDWQIQYQSFS